MTLPDIDWSVMRTAIVLFCVAVIGSAGIAWAGDWYRDELKSSFDKQKRRYVDMSNKYRFVDDEEQIINTYYPRYRVLEERGVIGEEVRLDWIDSLRDARARIKLPSLHYEITARQPYRPRFPLETGSMTLFASHIRLRLGLLHEEDLFTLFELLDSTTPGFYAVDNCDVGRARDEIGRDPTIANLNAECDLVWLTLQPGDNG